MKPFPDAPQLAPIVEHPGGTDMQMATASTTCTDAVTGTRATSHITAADTNSGRGDSTAAPTQQQQQQQQHDEVSWPQIVALRYSKTYADMPTR